MSALDDLKVARSAIDRAIAQLGAPLPPPTPPPTGKATLVCWDGMKPMKRLTNPVENPGYTDAQLAQVAAVGYGGLRVGTFHLPGMGGVDPVKEVPADFCARARKAGLAKLWYGVTCGDYARPISPYGDWFDDAGWASRVVPALTLAAKRAQELGFDGIALDNEGYQGVGGKTLTWEWRYPGKPATTTEAMVRAKAKARGAEVGAALHAGFPGQHIISYHDFFDASFAAIVQHVVNGKPLNFFSSTQLYADFWDGFATAPHGRVHFADSAFYFCPVLSGWTTRDAMRKNRDDMTAFFAVKGWHDFYVSPFLWMGPTNGDGSPWTQNASMQPAQAKLAAEAAREFCQDGLVFNYAYDHPLKFDYANFTSANRHIVNGDFRPAYRAVSQ